MPDETRSTSLHIHLNGDYDIARTAELRDTLLSEFGTQSEVIADVEAVTFMDSTALRTLLEVHAELRRRGAALTLDRVGPMVRRLLEISGTSELFGVPPSPRLS